MADVPVTPSSANTVVVVTANGQVAFDYDFRADKVEDLKAIYKAEASGTETLLVGGVNFIASGLGEASGGTVALTTFTSTVAGDTLTIYRDIEISRETDYSRDLFADDLNAEQDRVFMILQELARNIGRSLKVPIGVDTIDITAAGDPGQILVFDENRNLAPQDSSTGGVSGNMFKAVYDPAGYAANVFDRAVNVKWFGAKGDGVTDDTAAIQYAFNNFPEVFIPEGTFIQTSALGLPSDTIVRGAGIGKTILKFPDGADQVHHSIVSANAMSLDARLATPANVDTLISGYVEKSAIFDLSIDGNAYNRVKTYLDREQGTGLELHTVRYVVAQRVSIVNSPQHNFNIRAGTNSFNLGLDFVAPYPSQFVAFLDCFSDDQLIDDGITTHDSEYLWIERCVALLSRAQNRLEQNSASNGIEIDDGSRYVWVTDCLSKGSFGGYQAKGHENTPPAHHVWFNNCIAEDNHHAFIVSAVNTVTVDPDEIFGTCHNIHINDCTIKNLYNFTNGIGWEHSSNYVQMAGTRHVKIKNLTVVGKTEDKPNTDLTAGECYLRFRENNYHTTIDGIHFTAVNDRAGTLALIQAQSTNQKIKIKNVTVDQFTKAPVILTTDAGVDWTVEDISLLEGHASYPVVSMNGVGGGTLRARRISGVGSQAPCSLGGVLCPGYEEKDVSTRATSAESVYQRLVAGLDSANASGMQGANLGTTYNYSISGTVYRMGGVVVTPNNTNSITGTTITTRVGLYGRASGGSDMTPLYWAQEGSFYANLDNAYSCGSSGRRWSVVYAGTGTINTSDERAKQQIRELSEAERRVALGIKGMIRVFKFNDAVEKKGDGARWHFGVIAQEVKAAFEAEGLNAEDYGLFCYDEWSETPAVLDDDGNVLSPATPAGNAYGIRYEELLAFILGAI